MVSQDMRCVERDQLTPELVELFDKQKNDSGDLVVVEKIFRFYFRFIWFGNFDHQPFYKIMYWGRRQEGFDSTEESVTVEKMIPGYSHCATCRRTLLSRFHGSVLQETRSRPRIS